MMIAFARKNLSFFIWKHTCSPVCKSPVSFSLSLHFFSTSRKAQLGISPGLFDILVHKYDFPIEVASQVASKLTRLENPEKADSILSFLKESGFSNTQLVRIVKYRPRCLAASLEEFMKPKIEIFQEVGFSSDDMCKMISSNPAILGLSVYNNIIPSLSVLKGLLGSNYVLARVLRKSSWLIGMNLENTVVQNVELLKSYGMPIDRIRIILHGFPSSFQKKPEIMRKSAEKAKEMGVDPSSKKFIYAIPTIASMGNEAWKLKLQGFRDLGFSDSEIMTLFRKDPRVFMVSMEKIKKIKELLLATGKFNISSIINSPKSLESSVEKRYKPRLQILGILESKNLIKKWPSLGIIRSFSDDMFFKKFISPYLNEVGDVYIKEFCQGKMR